jgi:hypothetical protein
MVTGEAYPLNPGEPIGVFVMVLLLFCVIFLTGIHINDWVLTKSLGYAMITTHLAFCAFAVIITYH